MLFSGPVYITDFALQRTTLLNMFAVCISSSRMLSDEAYASVCSVFLMSLAEVKNGDLTLLGKIAEVQKVSILSQKALKKNLRYFAVLLLYSMDGQHMQNE